MIIDDEHLDFIFKNLYVTDIKNIEPIRKCINSNLSSATAEFILKLLAKKTIWKPLFPGDFVKLRIPADLKSETYELDVLMDLGLYDNNYIFGEVQSDVNTWRDHNPYTPMMTIHIFIHDKEKKIKRVSMQVNSATLTKIKKEEIPYYT
jgi:hypothetical protein